MAPPLLEGDAFKDPNNFGPRAVPSIEDGGVFSVYGETRINAPPQAVYDAILDIQRWKEWNTFVYDVKINQHPNPHKKDLRMVEGCNMTFLVRMSEEYKTTTKIECSHIQQLRTRASHSGSAITRIRWGFDNSNNFVPGFVMKSERVMEIEELEDGTTFYRNWETFGGLAARYTRKKFANNLRDGFADWCRDLKSYVEGQTDRQGVGYAQERSGHA